jgi:hypothetical protein
VDVVSWFLPSGHIRRENLKSTSCGYISQFPPSLIPMREDLKRTSYGYKYWHRSRKAYVVFYP